ncbi:urease accessory protein UreF [Salipiger aestuarii]|nr:urease accessory protein UreF [Salipiger aestuarii]KAA8607017.1 urease accessory protein UreF [Salipiger aestuarii]KAA8610717.1 urease accessory protein UreF [Salipiger aestuarii]KAB2541544.1 urease accessory protein UreF [Salipiger aestuarii]
MTTDPSLTLHQIFSPAFPVGSFAWSHGLETAVQQGQVSDADGLENWLAAVLRHGAGWSDAVLLACAARGEDAAALTELGRALSPSAERRAETMQQGRAFAATVSDVWGVAIPAAPYPVAVGLTVRALALPPGVALRLYLQAFAANLTGAGLRLIPLGQTDGQRITLALSPLCAELAAAAQDAGTDDIGGFAPLLDIASQRHDMLYSRLFRS